MAAFIGFSVMPPTVKSSKLTPTFDEHVIQGKAAVDVTCHTDINGVGLNKAGTETTTRLSSQAML